MALTTPEISRIKAELGYSLLSVQQVYLPSVWVFEGVIQQYLTGGYSTTSATAVDAADDGQATPVTITLADATGFAAGNRVVIDVDDLQETATIRSISGATISVALRLAHPAGYPVAQEGDEWMVREKLREIRNVRAEMGQTFGTGTLKKVDEIEFYKTNGTAFGELGRQLATYRDELAAILGIQSMWSARAEGAQRLSVY